LNSLGSENASEVICKPAGNPFESFPIGTEMAGIPANEDCTVNISDKYIAIGSLVFPPISNAVVGVVGEIIKS
jgi:hypothetical protein